MTASVSRPARTLRITSSCSGRRRTLPKVSRSVLRIALDWTGGFIEKRLTLGERRSECRKTRARGRQDSFRERSCLSGLPRRAKATCKFSTEETANRRRPSRHADCIPADRKRLLSTSTALTACSASISISRARPSASRIRRSRLRPWPGRRPPPTSPTVRATSSARDNPSIVSSAQAGRDAGISALHEVRQEVVLPKEERLEILERRPDVPTKRFPILFVRGFWHGAWCLRARTAAWRRRRAGSTSCQRT